MSTAIVPFSYSDPKHCHHSLKERIFSINDRTIRMRQSHKFDGKGGSDIGFGASVYNASFVLGDYVAANDIAKNKHVMELGAGTGLVSIACSYCAPLSITCTDGDKELLDLTKINIESNCNGISDVPVKLQKLYWGNEEDISILSLKKYDLILGADIAAYPYRDAFESLFQTLDTLSSTGTLILLAYQRRHSIEDTFFKRCNEVFEVKTIDRKYIHEDFQFLAAPQIDIISLRKK